MYENINEVNTELKHTRKEIEKHKNKEKQLLEEKSLQEEINDKLKKIHDFYKKERSHLTHLQLRYLDDLLEELRIGFRSKTFDCHDAMEQYVTLCHAEIGEIRDFITTTEKYIKEH